MQFRAVFAYIEFEKAKPLENSPSGDVQYPKSDGPPAEKKRDDVQTDAVDDPVS